MNDVIKEIANTSTQALDHVRLTGARKIKKFHFNCCELEDFNFNCMRKVEKYKSTFEEIDEFDGPSLYYFEITSTHAAEEIVNRVRQYRLTENSKTVPAIKVNYPNSNILYVGKVKRKLGDRIIQHFGYYKVQKTQALQLYHWTNGMNLNLRLTVLEFEPEMKNFMEVLESGLAKELKPILGKHR